MSKSAKKLTKKPATKAKSQEVLADRGESVSEMEPLVVSEISAHRPRLNELVFELVGAATGFKASLPDGMVEALSDVVRSMNCYYSNLIEGHNTHPIEIERALSEDYSTNKEQRNLQLEAKAHIAAQRWIDEGGLKGKSATVASVIELHRRFEGALPPELLWVEDPNTKRRVSVIPGITRADYAKVGRHIVISPGAVPRFLVRWESAFGRLSKFETVLQSAAAHHRLLWIHPFADGNGRVTRLMSYAMLHEALDTGGIWSIARGLARSENEYKQHLAACDSARRNDLDGRGALSEEALSNFTAFFLATCLDQIKFMTELMQPAALRKRIIAWAKDEENVGGIMENSHRALSHILTNRELERKDAPDVLGLDDRKARRVTARLSERGIITATTHKAPFRIAFPASLAPALLPGLYPRLNRQD